MNKETSSKRKSSSSCFSPKKIRQDELTQDNYIKNRRFLMAGGLVNGRQRLTNVIRNYGGHVTTSFANLDYIVIGPGPITQAMFEKLAQDTTTTRIEEDELLNFIVKSKPPSQRTISEDVNENNQVDYSHCQFSPDTRIKIEEVDLSDLELENEQEEGEESIPASNSLFEETGSNNNIQNDLNFCDEIPFQEQLQEGDGENNNSNVGNSSTLIPNSNISTDNQSEDREKNENQSDLLEENDRILEIEIPSATAIEYYKQRTEAMEREKLELSSLLQNQEQQIKCLAEENKMLRIKVQEQQLVIDQFTTTRNDNGSQSNANNVILDGIQQQQEQPPSQQQKQPMIKKPLLPLPISHHPPSLPSPQISSPLLPLLLEHLCTHPPPSIKIIPPAENNNPTTQNVPPEALSETESLNFILDKLKIKDCPITKGKCQELSELLKRLPLALSQAVNYIKNQQEEQQQEEKQTDKKLGSTNGILHQISKYIQDFNFIMYKTNLIEEVSNSSRFPVYNSWTLTLDKIKTMEYGSFALQILNNVAFLLPQNIPLSLLRYLLSPEIQGTDLAEGLKLLEKYCLVKMDEGARTLSVAKQLQLLVLLNIIEYDDDDMMFVIFNNVLDKCNSTLHTLINSSADNRLDMNDILLNFQHIVDQTRSNVIPETNELLNFSEELALSYQHFGQYEKALDLYKQILERDVKIYGENNKVTRNLQHNIAHILKLSGKLEEALDSYLKILDKDKKLLHENHPITLTTKNNIACVLRDLGRFDDSLKFFNHVFEERKKTLELNHPSTLNSERGIASVYAKKGDYNRALRMYIQVERKQAAHKDLGSDHLDTLATLQEKCIVWIHLDQRQSAETILREIYMKRKQSLGENHPETISTLSWIAVCMGNKLK